MGSAHVLAQWMAAPALDWGCQHPTRPLLLRLAYMESQAICILSVISVQFLIKFLNIDRRAVESHHNLCAWVPESEMNWTTTLWRPWSGPEPWPSGPCAVSWGAALWHACSTKGSQYCLWPLISGLRPLQAVLHARVCVWFLQPSMKVILLSLIDLFQNL